MMRNLTEFTLDLLAFTVGWLSQGFCFKDRFSHQGRARPHCDVHCREYRWRFFGPEKTNAGPRRLSQSFAFVKLIRTCK
jgi:hypothetical protein